LKKIGVIRPSFSPTLLKAIVVFSKVGLAVALTIASISSLAISIAFLIATL